MPASPEPLRVLVLGGTSEGAALARRLDGDARFEVISSLAGATRHPAALPGRLKHGGFGGADGLAAYLKAERIDRVVDATHPYAARISAHAAEACGMADVALLRLARPPWRRQGGDRWIEVDDAAAAARALPGLGRRIFLSLGRKDLAAFAGLDGIWFLVRLIEAPAVPLPLPRHELVLGRGPFRREDEIALLRRHAVEAVVSKNSGGAATYAKIEAARVLGLPVVMLRHPPEPAGVASFATVDAALTWLSEGRDGG